MIIPDVTRVLLAGEGERALVKGLVVLDWGGAHVLPYFSSEDRAKEFAAPGRGGVPHGPGVTWRTVGLSSDELLYLLNESNVRIDEVLEDPLPVAVDYSTAPIDAFVSRLEIESGQTPQPVEGYKFFVS